METLLFPLLILFMIGLLFMSNRTRKKQEAKQQSLQQSLHVGDVVVMTSGVSGTIVDVDDERTIDLEIAPDVITTWLRAAVREKLVDETEDTTSPTDDGDDVEAAPESSIDTSSTPAVTDGPASSNGTLTKGGSAASDGSVTPRSS